MLMCSSFEPQRILILLPSSTNSCTVFSYLTERNQIAWQDWPECKYCCLQQLMAFCRNLINQVISSPAAQINVQAPRNLFLNNDIRKTKTDLLPYLKNTTLHTECPVQEIKVKCFSERAHVCTQIHMHI